MRKLSIIIPVYNVEKYIDECVESITSQILDESDNVEIILVDDGSKDKSGNKCDMWSDRYPYITTVHKANGGLSSARNVGLDVATGEYVLFVDSDDRVAAGSVNSILKSIVDTNADIYFLSGIKFYPNGKRELLDTPMSRDSIYQKNGSEVIKYISGLSRYPGSACTKAYKRKFLSENLIRFPSDRRISEDLGFTLQCLLAAEIFDVVKGDYYEYRQEREGSITSNSTSANKAFWNLTIFLRESVDLLADNQKPKTIKAENALGLVAYEYFVALVHFCHVTEHKDEAMALMKELKWLSNYLTSKRGRVIVILLRLLGIKLTSKILSIAYSVRERRNSQ